MEKTILTALICCTLGTSIQVKAASTENSITNDTAYCYITYDQAGGPTGPAKFSLSNPQVITLIENQSDSTFVCSGTWIDNQWYGSEYISNKLVTIDMLTGKRTLIHNMDFAFMGLAFDFTTMTLFGVAYNANSGESSLHSIDRTIGNSTLIGTCGTEILINLACDVLGNIYSVGISNDILYRIDKNTGAFTAIGSIGFDANYAQDMEYDYNTGIMYLAAYNVATSSGELRTVDLNTGATTLIGAFQNGMQLTSLAIPTTNIPVSINSLPKNSASFLLYQNPANCLITYKSDVEYFTFELFNLQGKKIFSEKRFTHNGDFDLTKQPKGLYLYQVKSNNNKLSSGKISIK